MARICGKTSAASRCWYEWRIRRSLAAEVVVVAIGILDLDLSEHRFLLSGQVVIVLNRSLALTGEGWNALN
jgi:hypothetical protein